MSERGERKLRKSSLITSLLEHASFLPSSYKTGLVSPIFFTSCKTSLVSAFARHMNYYFYFKFSFNYLIIIINFLL